MGQTLSEPITSKESLYAQNDKFKVGLSCMQGWRVTMEDSHTALLAIPEDPSAAFFGVFDGHGGARISNYAGKHLYKFIVRQECYSEGNIKAAIEQGFQEIDVEMRNDKHLRDELGGSTAVIVLIKDNKLYCGNTGDSRAIAVVQTEIIPLSVDHKPNLPEEFERIREAGCWVEYNRVNGNLALSRALGDYLFKQNQRKSLNEQAVTSFPDVVEKDITEDWSFIVIACDGIWDVMTNEEVAEFVKSRLEIGLELEVICEELMMRCLAPDSQMGGIGCDNMTVIIVLLSKPENKNELLRTSDRSPMTDIK